MALTEIDRQLLTRCLASEPGAWKDFVDRFHGLFVHVVQHTAHIRSVRVTPHDVDDLCAEVFLAIVASDYHILREFRSRSSLATYLAVIARRIVVREMARRKLAESFGHVQAHQDSLDQANAHSPPVSREQQRIENREEIELMLEGLDPHDAQIVRLFHLEGRSYREISERLGIPENSIGPALTRARERLRSRTVGSKH